MAVIRIILTNKYIFFIFHLSGYMFNCRGGGNKADCLVKTNAHDRIVCNSGHAHCEMKMR